MIQFIEAGNRVFEVEMLPDTPGYCHRKITFKIVSGPPLGPGEYERISAWFVAEPVAQGADVTGWGPCR